MLPNESRRGSYQIQNRETGVPWSQWRVATRETDQQMGYLKEVEKQHLTPAVVKNLAAHLKIASPNLMPLVAESTDRDVFVFTAMPSGVLLAEHLQPDVAIAPSKACRIGIAICQSLAALHAQSIVHGNVRTDRVWIARDGRILLLRDPAVLAMNQGRSSASDWLVGTEPEMAYAAPEFADPDQSADALTDIYSLGCLLYRLVTGQSAVAVSDWDTALDQHARISPPELVSAIENPQSAEPLMRVVAYAMAKQRPSRFQSAEKMLVALQVAASNSSDQVQVGLPAKHQTTGIETLTPRVEPGTSTRRSRRSRKSSWPRFVVASAGGTIVVLAGLGWLLWGGNDSGDQVVVAPDRVPASDPPNVLPPRATVSSDPGDTVPGDPFELVDDPQLLYAPPFSADADAISLGLLPPGAAAIASVRPEALLSDAHGDSLAELFATELSQWVATLESRSGLSAQSIERCTIAVHPGSDGILHTSLAIESTEPVSIDVLAERLGVFASRTADGATIYAGDDVDGDAYFFSSEMSPASQVRRYAVGSIDRITEVAASDGAPILLPTRLMKLWEQTSTDADFALLAPSNFFFADGRSWLELSMPAAIPSLGEWLIPEVTAILLLGQLESEHTYAETRLIPGGDTSEIQVFKRLEHLVADLPERADQFLLQAQPDPAWRLLAARLPLMVRFATSHTRIGIADRSTVANLYLPRSAALQLLLASALALNTPRHGSPVVEPSQAAPRLTIDQMLDRPMSIAFGQESLEFALDTIAQEFQRTLPPGISLPPIRIMGGELQKLGITQNQQIRDFRKADVPLRTVLTDLLVAANPDPTATGPKDSKQVLVWVVADDPAAPRGKSIHVTTRPSATGKYRLPPEFLDPR